MWRRPEDHKRLALYTFYGNRPKKARVARVAPVVPHHKDLAGRHLNRTVIATIWERVVDVRLFPAFVVHKEHTVADPDLISRHAHDALYQLFPIALDTLEDNYITPLRLREAIDKLVDKDPVTDLKGWDHALCRYVESLDDEGSNKAEHQSEGNQQYNKKLKEPSALFG